MVEATPTTTTVTPAPAAWHTGIPNADPELIGHITNRGWHEKTAAEAAYDAAKAHKEAEKLIGVPANQLLRLPQDAKDEVGWKNVWSRLGAPAEAKDYDFSAIKFADGSELDAKFVDAFRAAASQLHLPKDAAAGVVKEFAKFLDGADAAEAAEAQAKLAGEKTTLDKNWGVNKEANMFVAKRAAEALGVTPAEVQALENQIGYARVMEMFRTIGTKIGEDKFVSGNRPNAGVMTVGEAKAKLSELKSDAAWATRLLNGDVTTKREFEALTTIISGDDTEGSRRA